MTDSTTNDAPMQSGRAPYRSPELTVFGSLADLTEAIGSHATNDGGAVGGMMRSGY